MTGPKTPFAEQLHAEKYRAKGENFKEAMNRVAGALTSNEVEFRGFRELLCDMRFMPAGRVQAAVGATRRTTAYNCFVSPAIDDTFVDGPKSIMGCAGQAATTMRMGGGIGYDFSTLRPRGDLIKKLQSKSSGPVSFMEIFDAVGRATSSAGHRRGAQMGVLRVDHPDIEEFVHAKQKPGFLTGFNMSVGITDKFMESLATGKPFELSFGGQSHGEIDAAQLWETIMRSTFDWAEPGVLFIDTINRMNNLNYCETIAATNPCVPAGTPTLTRFGWEKIEKLVGKTCQIWNGYEWSSVVPRVTGHNEPLYKITFSDGRELSCTKGHKFVLSDGTRVEARDLKIGAKLVKASWPVVEAGNTNLDAYEQGFFSGDGWVGSRGRCYIGLYGEKKELVNEFNGTVSREYAISGGYEGTDTTETRVYVQVSAKREKNFVPNCDWSVASRLDWLAGVMDSDGCTVSCDNGIAIQISAKDREFLSSTQLLINTLGAASTLGMMKDCWRLSISASNTERLVSSGLNTRRLKLEGNAPKRDASRFVQVVDVEFDGVADIVYCFTEEKNHTGCFNGVVTSNCGEQPLPPYGACLLGSFNLAKYITASRSFDWEQFRKDIPVAVRAMDRVTDVSLYPLVEQKHEAKSKRRMGLGVTGLANCIEAIGPKYGTHDFVRLESRILETLRDESYRASMMLAQERGSFSLFDKTLYPDGDFIQTLPYDLQRDIAKYGIRNSHLTSIAPTGTISMCADNVSSGIEPVFALRSNRIVNLSDGAHTVESLDYGLATFGVEGKTCDIVTVQEHLDVLVAAAERVDSAVSKTCNVPSDISWSDFKGLYVQAYERGAKGCTTYRVGGKREGILTAANDNQDVAGAACVYDPATGVRSCE